MEENNNNNNNNNENTTNKKRKIGIHNEPSKEENFVINTMTEMKDAKYKTIFFDGIDVVPINPEHYMFNSNSPHGIHMFDEKTQQINGSTLDFNTYSYAYLPLLNEKIAFFGGMVNNNIVSTVQLFDRNNKNVSVIGNMVQRRHFSCVVLLNPDVAFIVGGGQDYSDISKTCELFDFRINKSRVVKAKMREKRAQSAVSLLANGNVIIFGGYGVRALHSTEIYNPISDSFTDAAPMLLPRYGHSATKMFNGEILICGGGNFNFSNLTEIYDPKNNKFREGPRMVRERLDPFATLLSDGRVLLYGGQLDVREQTAEIYDPTTNSFSLVQ